MRVKPIFVFSRGAGLFVESSGALNMIMDKDETQSRTEKLLNELKAGLDDNVTVLDALHVGTPDGFEPVFSNQHEIDVLLVYFLGVTPIEPLLNWPGPIIAFSGQHTPAFALYALGDERGTRSNISIALDYEDIRKRLKAIEVKKKLAKTKTVLFGSPPSWWYLRWYAWPDLEHIRRTTGIQFIPVELRELIETTSQVDQKEVVSLAEKWLREAHDVQGPNQEDLEQSAAIFLAMSQILSRYDASAMAMNCLEITQSPKFAGQMTNPCLAMSHLRDKGIPSACETDVAALITMMLLGHLSRKAAFMGNIVRADPETNIIKLSHCILPTKMQGLDQTPLPYGLRDFHGTQKGVTAFTYVPPGIKVTLARIQRNLERIVALSGEVSGCEDTAFCRNTLTLEIDDAREFVQQAEGNHHVLVFGDYLNELEALCIELGCRFHTV